MTTILTGKKFEVWINFDQINYFKTPFWLQKEIWNCYNLGLILAITCKIRFIPIFLEEDHTIRNDSQDIDKISELTSNARASTTKENVLEVKEGAEDTVERRCREKPLPKKRKVWARNGFLK